MRLVIAWLDVRPKADQFWRGHTVGNEDGREVGCQHCGPLVRLVEQYLSVAQQKFSARQRVSGFVVGLFSASAVDFTGQLFEFG